MFNGNSPITISGHSLENDNNRNYGPVTLTQALTYSINTVYAPLGLKLGSSLMQQYMQRFGFYQVPPIDYPVNELLASGELFFQGACNHSTKPKLLPVTNSCVDLGRTAIGQANLAVTPMQMAMVVSAIADDGKMMEPRLTSRIVNNDGQVVEKISPKEYDQVMKPKAAGELHAMMRDVVEEGTGTAANLEGLAIAGKTGTASTGLCYHEQPVNGSCPNGEPLDDAWFVGFPESDPKIAVAVELTDIRNGYGGTYAAPIAAKIIEALLAEKR
jgi:peptidoglycan glycosyltransferase